MNAALALNHPQPVKLTLDEFDILADAGAFVGNGRTELIEGEIFVMNALHRPHSFAHTRILRRLADALDSLALGFEPLIAPSVRMEPDSAPEPDIVVTSEPLGERMVPVASVRLIVEVAHSTAPFDMTRKAALYARYAVPEYWVVDLDARRVHQMWQPADSRYLQQRAIDLGGDVASVAIEGLTLNTGGLV